MQALMHEYHERMPFVYSCILCDEVYHDTELLAEGVPPVCHECRKREEDSARVCWVCGDPVVGDNVRCYNCVTMHACNSEKPAPILAHIMNGETR